MEDLGSDGPDDSTGGLAVHTETRLERLGDYRILREVGRGGMGVVYEAEQESLGRRVALKVLPDAALSDAQQVLRFQREARAAARLHHTNIVPVFGVGRDEGHHYYVMQFIPGMGLDAVLEELRRLRTGVGSASPPGRRGPSHGAVSAADGGRGDPHRTVLARRTGRRNTWSRDHAGGVYGRPRSSGPPLSRPGRRFLGDQPARRLGRLAGPVRPRPHLLPQRGPHRPPGRRGAGVCQPPGRAPPRRQAVQPPAGPQGQRMGGRLRPGQGGDGEDITHSGDIVGTVRYMAPERFAGKCDARSDVYALGLTLYELLALRPAFEASDRHELMRRVMSEEPQRLRGLVPNIPRDLETIVQKAIDREPIERYPSAAALAEDLQRFLDDKPIKARRVTPVEQAWRWARRNPGGGLAGRRPAGLARGRVWSGVTWQWRQAAANLAVAESANRKAQARFGLAMEAVRLSPPGPART